MASQAANPWISSTALDYQNVSLETDALAIAPYFAGPLGSPDEGARIRSMSPEALLDELEVLWVPRAAESLGGQLEVARSRGVRLVAYEAGQHMTGVSGAQDDAAQRSLRRGQSAPSDEGHLREVPAGVARWRR
jgi:hypothetical protein